MTLVNTSGERVESNERVIIVGCSVIGATIDIFMIIKALREHEYAFAVYFLVVLIIHVLIITGELREH